MEVKTGLKGSAGKVKCLFCIARLKCLSRLRKRAMMRKNTDGDFMVEADINLFDAAVVLVMGLSTLLSFFRGFVREILSLGAWIGASMITVYMFPTTAKMLQPHLSNAVAAAGLAAIGTFFVALVSLSIVNMMLVRLFKKGSEAGMLDNALGLIFGAARGFFLLSLGFYVMTLVLDEESYPEPIQQARTKDFVAYGATMVAKVAPDYLKAVDPNAENEEGESSEDADATLDKPKDDTEKGYDWMNVQELERLMDSSE